MSGFKDWASSKSGSLYKVNGLAGKGGTYVHPELAHQELSEKATAASEKAGASGLAVDHANAAVAHKAVAKAARVVARSAVEKSIREVRAPNASEDRKAEDWGDKAKESDAKASAHQDKANSLGWDESKHPRGPDGKFT